MNDREREELVEVLALMYEGERRSIEILGGRRTEYINARNRLEKLLGEESEEIRCGSVEKS